MSEFREVGRYLKDAAGGVSTKSVINPLLWLSAIVVIPSFAASILSDEPYKFYFFITGIVIAATTVGVYVWFAIADPDRLQDEEFRLRDKALTIFGDSATDRSGMDQIIHGRSVTPAIIENQIKSVADRKGDLNG